eukprot:TRINITY_DN11781_c0_g1_i2.p1 TRINITY_DN11781_c0_g1~~TRINITY_DN11781_c0_g1_i2.p1  ORF type:complete len:975 (+),score=271.67 TRINITY_DN11781_c0_g1_i2:494-3418(+)
MGDEAVRVAVRVRPFNSREKAAGAKLIIKMSGNSTTITDPEDNSEKVFAFDYSYWSHDGFEEQENGYLAPTDPHYADQKKVFEDVGRGVLANAWDGYNCSLFAYGQTGSGKSYSMVGYGENKGIVPVTCEQLFEEIEAKADDNKLECQVTFSMLEIYNEQVRDLLAHERVKGGMKVRQHPKKGFYVENLRVVPVSNYADIEARIEEGTKNRTIAATNMNATSSRAHTIVTVNFAQKLQNEDNVNMTKSSSINLVDLAGSERAESTGATGDRLKEGAAINKSLSTLGNVISTLVEVQNGNKKVIIPFRDSVLTKLLKNALNGNSKTVMIAALSPADINFDETLSTLRFADRAKAIKTKAVVNETPTERLIRELKEENARLLEQLKAGILPEGMSLGPPGAAESEEDIARRKEVEDQLRRQMEDNARLEEQMQSWEQKLQEAEAEKTRAMEARNAEKQRRKQEPHFWNMNADPALSGVVAYFLNDGETIVGNGKAPDVQTDMELTSVNILPKHATISASPAGIFIQKHSKRATIYINGAELGDEKHELHHFDRVLFAPGQLYCLTVPAVADAGVHMAAPTYEEAQDEIARLNGLTADGEMSPEQQLLQAEIVELVPHVAEASAIAAELKINKDFNIEVVSSYNAEDGSAGAPQVKVRVDDTEREASWLWSPSSFMSRKFAMQEMYANFADGDDWQRKPEEDPFQESFEKQVHIGFCSVYIKNLAYLVEVEQSLNIMSYRAEPKGKVDIEILPCDERGRPTPELDDVFIDNPDELLGQRVDFLVHIKAARNVPAHFNNLRCKFAFYDHKPVESDPIKTTGAEEIKMGFQHQVTIHTVTEDFLIWLNKSPMIVDVTGDQTGTSESKPVMLSKLRGNTLTSLALPKVQDEQLFQLKCEVHLYKKLASRAQEKLNAVKEVVDKAKGDKVSGKAIKAAIGRKAIGTFRAAVTSVMISNAAARVNSAGQETTSAESTVCSVM